MSAANFTSPDPGPIWVGRQPSASSRTQELLLMASGGNQAVFSLLSPLAVPLLLKPRYVAPGIGPARRPTFRVRAGEDAVRYWSQANRRSIGPETPKAWR